MNDYQHRLAAAVFELLSIDLKKWSNSNLYFSPLTLTTLFDDSPCDLRFISFTKSLLDPEKKAKVIKKEVKSLVS